MSKARATIGSLSRSACSRGSPSMARVSVTGLAGFCGTSLHSRSTCPYGICSTRPTSRSTPRACSVPKVMICATRSRPYRCLHVADHLVAAVLAEIDVEVRHRDALGIEEALENEPEADRIEIGDGQRIGHQRAGARTAARPDRNALRFRPLDEIGDDQEVAGIFHLHDDAELEGEALADSVRRCARAPVRVSSAARARPARAACAALGLLVVDSLVVTPRPPKIAAGSAPACAGGTRSARRSRQSRPAPPANRQTAPPFRRGS